jgi:transglutaminase-like putative cysteine protease
VVLSTVQIKVSDNRIDPPQLAAPAPAVAADLGKVRWSATANGGIRPDRRPDTYTIRYVRVQPTEQQLQSAQADPVTLADSGVTQNDLDVDESSRPTLDAILEKIVPPDATAIDTARAIQGYLRGSAFTYSLTLADPAPEDHGDPLVSFLRTKQGYCIQFATAMVMMARDRGIPARMAIGFLPGHLESDTSWTVHGTDAHAWPELWFPGLGWLRFEPTPSGRSGAAPIYTTAPIATVPTGGATTSVPGATSSPSSSPRTIDNQLDNPGALNPATSAPARLWHGITALPAWFWLLAVLVIGALGSLALPTAAALQRRRALAAAGDAAGVAEAHWQSFLRQIDDLGVRPPTGSTPRQTGRFVAVSAHLAPEDVERLRSVVDTIERARYAAPGTEVGDLAAPIKVVVTSVGRTRPRLQRLGAFLNPTDGRSQVHNAVSGALEAPRRAWSRLKDLLPR